LWFVVECGQKGDCHGELDESQLSFLLVLHKLACVSISKPNVTLSTLEKKIFFVPSFLFFEPWTYVPKRYRTPTIYLITLIGNKYLNPYVYQKVFFHAPDLVS
jgi:hypothetical protein